MNSSLTSRSTASREMSPADEMICLSRNGTVAMPIRLETTVSRSASAPLPYACTPATALLLM